jgi:hypothetical protein
MANKNLSLAIDKLKRHPPKGQTMTDNVTLIRYKAAVDFLKQPLSAASDAAHELRSDDDDDDEVIDNRIKALGYITFMANDLCNAKLQLLESITHLLWKDEEHGDDEHEQQSN